MLKSLFECTSSKLVCNPCYDNVDLELISDADIYLFSETRMKGGVSYIFRDIV